MHKKAAVLTAIVAIAALALLWTVRQENTKQREAKQLQRIAQTNELRKRVAEFAQKNGASTAWDGAVTDRYGLAINPLLTAELERVWLNATPTMFLGKLEHISQTTDDADHVMH